jgi:hypothetical protein
MLIPLFRKMLAIAVATLTSDTEDSGSDNPNKENEAPDLTMPRKDATAEELCDVSRAVNCSLWKG